MAEFNLQKMKKQFEEVNNMLDKLVGGNTATSLLLLIQQILQTETAQLYVKISAQVL